MAGSPDIIRHSMEHVARLGELDELHDRHASFLRSLDPDVRKEFEEKFDMSWIYHDSALEGQVLTPQEIWTALNTQVRADSAFQPSLNEVRRHKEAIEHIHGLVDKKKITIGPELIRRLYNILASEDDQLTGSLVYRKDIPIHRTYFHEIVPPNRLPQQMKRFFEWAKNPANRKAHQVHFASSLHYRLMRTFPFTRHTGKIARLVMNLVLIRAGYPPAVIHSTERQNYYEAIRDGYDEVLAVVCRALMDTMRSNIRTFEEQ